MPTLLIRRGANPVLALSSGAGDAPARGTCRCGSACAPRRGTRSAAATPCVAPSPRDRAPLAARGSVRSPPSGGRGPARESSPQLFTPLSGSPTALCVCECVCACVALSPEPPTLFVCLSSQLECSQPVIRTLGRVPAGGSRYDPGAQTAFTTRGHASVQGGADQVLQRGYNLQAVATSSGRQGARTCVPGGRRHAMGFPMLWEVRCVAWCRGCGATRVPTASPEARWFTARDAAVAGEGMRARVAADPGDESRILRGKPCGATPGPTGCCTLAATSQLFERGGGGDRTAARVDGCVWCRRSCGRERRATDGSSPGDRWHPGTQNPGLQGVASQRCSECCVFHSRPGASDMRAHWAVGCLAPATRILTESRTDAVVFKGLGGTQGAETGGRGHR